MLEAMPAPCVLGAEPRQDQIGLSPEQGQRLQEAASRQGPFDGAERLWKNRPRQPAPAGTLPLSCTQARRKTIA